jgi:hypothetical protein
VGVLVPLFSAVLASVAPNRNIRKKFTGVKPPDPAGASASAPISFPPFRSAAARLPFCNARRKPSKLPSTPDPATSCASENARSVLPTSEAAVAAAATDRSRDSMAA